jgi:transposase
MPTTEAAAATIEAIPPSGPTGEKNGRKRVMGARRLRIAALITAGVAYADICREFHLSAPAVYAEAREARRLGLLSAERRWKAPPAQSAASYAAAREAAETAAGDTREAQIAADAALSPMDAAVAAVPRLSRQIADAVHVQGWDPHRLARRLGVTLSVVAAHLAAEREARQAVAENCIRTRLNPAPCVGKAAA